MEHAYDFLIVRDRFPPSSSNFNFRRQALNALKSSKEFGSLNSIRLDSVLPMPLHFTFSINTLKNAILTK